jgi:cation diffusion facilitator CzcD-associated flavoprotein CzcO
MAERLQLLRKHLASAQEGPCKGAAPAGCAAPAAASGHFDVVVVGSGFSGLLCAAYLRDAGVENVRIFEMTPAVGGVWSTGGVGAYPGAACDVPAYTYLPLLDRTGFVPSKKYVSQPEISGYAEMLTDQTGVRAAIVFGRKVTDVRHLGRGGAVWQVETVDTETGAPADVATCTHVVLANGPLSSPRMPEIPGMGLFQGASFHTAQWDRSAEYAGKRVAVVGTGASAAQVITAIADDCAALTVFQRTPTWCLPRDDEPTPPELAAKFAAGDGYGEGLRAAQAADDAMFNALHDEAANAEICAGLAQAIRQAVPDPELAARLTPDYPFFCKRALFIDDYYTAFNKPNVALVDDPGGVVGVDATGVTIARGEHFEADVIIYATGFDSNFIPFNVEGRGGRTLAEQFGAEEANNFQMAAPRSLWGMHVEAMPNLYMMVGPQSLNPVTNVTLLCEEQAKYIAELVAHMAAAGHGAVEPTEAAVAAWTEKCEASSDGKVWLRCNNWYMKTTKTDAAQDRPRASTMWMESYPAYMKQLRGGVGGTQEELLAFS